MSDSRWQRVEEIFHQAAELAPEARPAFLDQACAGDESLRREIESLLAHDAEDGSTLAKAVANASGDTVTMVEDLSGRTIGPYKVLGRLGEGGMGVVYKAKDTRLGRSVALKFIKAQFSRHWEREARAVAALNHPHIATLYEVGDHQGSPYLAMEFVEGRPLKSPLPVKQAIEYGIQIADALAAAHAAGIVPRHATKGVSSGPPRGWPLSAGERRAASGEAGAPHAWPLSARARTAAAPPRPGRDGGRKRRDGFVPGGRQWRPGSDRRNPAPPMRHANAGHPHARRLAHVAARRQPQETTRPSTSMVAAHQPLGTAVVDRGSGVAAADSAMRRAWGFVGRVLPPACRCGHTVS